MKINFQTAVCLLLICAVFQGCRQKADRPNIVLIMVDDMGFSDIGLFGSEIPTPHIDRLAGEGLVMTQFYNAGRCCPSRASLMTGLYPHQVGVGDMLQDDGLPGYTTHLRRNGITIAEVLKMCGYHTMISGKWHLGMDEPHWPMKRGFDRQYASSNTTGHYFGVAEGRPYVVEDQRIDPPGEWIEAGETRYKLLKNEDGSQWYATNAYTDRAIGYIHDLRQSAPDQPFFLYLPYTVPHWPLHALPDDIQRHKGRYDIGWDSLRSLRYRKLLSNDIIRPEWSLSERNEHVPAWASLSDSARHYYASLMEVYAAMIDNMDQNIGKLIATLDALGELDRTLILFLSDNGGCHEAPHRGKPGAEPGSPDSFDGYEYAWANVSNTPFRWFKHWVHEGGIATPLIVRYPPLIQPGSRSAQVGHIMDIMPTLVELTGAVYPSVYKDSTILPSEGKSMLPVFRGEALRTDGDVLCWEHEGNRAVRQGRWKLVARFDDDSNAPMPWELYDLHQDRTESHDRSEEYPEKVRQMAAVYDAWAARCNVLPYEALRAWRNALRPKQQ